MTPESKHSAVTVTHIQKSGITIGDRRVFGREFRQLLGYGPTWFSTLQTRGVIQRGRTDPGGRRLWWMESDVREAMERLKNTPNDMAKCGGDFVKRKQSKPAKPTGSTVNNNGANVMSPAHLGITKRELFAAMFVQAIMSNPNADCDAYDKARIAVRQANILIKELEK